MAMVLHLTAPGLPRPTDASAGRDDVKHEFEDHPDTPAWINALRGQVRQIGYQIAVTLL
jgi:hypothetical protein